MVFNDRITRINNGIDEILVFINKLKDLNEYILSQHESDRLAKINKNVNKTYTNKDAYKFYKKYLHDNKIYYTIFEFAEIFKNYLVDNNIEFKNFRIYGLITKYFDEENDNKINAREINTFFETMKDKEVRKHLLYELN